MSVVRILVLFVACSLPTLAQGGIPKSVTPPNWPLKFERIASPIGERILAVAYSKQGVLVAGTAGNGVLRSTDGGESWQNTSLHDGDIWPIHAAPSGALYAFRREGWTWRFEVFRSSDGGITWSTLPDSSSRYFGNAIVKSSGMNMYAEGGGGLHVSTDDGTSWRTIRAEPPMASCPEDYDLEILSDSVLFARCYAGLIRSGDGGKSWRQISTIHAWYSSMQRDPAGGVLVAATDTAGGNYLDELIRVSYDGSRVEAVGPGPFGGNIPISILLDDGIFLAASVESSDTIMRSLDSGRTWVATSGIRAAVSDFCQCPDGTVFAATHGGLYRSHDNGETWEDCPVGTTRRTVKHLFDDGNSTIYAGTGDAGLFISNDDCMSWKSAGNGYCAVVDGFSLAPGHVLTGMKLTQPSLIYVLSGVIFMDRWGWAYTMDLSWDGGQTWKPLECRQDAIDFLRHGADSLALTDGRTLNLSTDGGNSWTADPTLNGAKDIAALRGGLFVLHHNDTLYFREDGREEWEFVHTAERGLAIGGDNARLLLLENGAISRSTDAGKTWRRIPVNDVRYHDPEIVALDYGRFFAVTGIGEVVLLSSDFGESWKRIVPDPDRRLFVYCAYTDSFGRLLLGTDDGLYRSTMGLLGSTTDYSFRLGVPYPNPATSPVTIPYTLEEAAYVKLTIHDISGRERGILHEGYHGPGTYFFGLHNLYATLYGGAGLYFINLSVNGKVQTQPLVFPE